MYEVFLAQGAIIDKVYFCPFHPEHGIGHYKIDSPYRKPAPGMIYQAAQEFDVDLAKSVLVGDKESDIQAGIAAGVGCNVLYNSSGLRDAVDTAASAVVNTLNDINGFLGRYQTTCAGK
ncbi:MAG: HAD hydrolase-like protein [Methylobacter sp.]|nr:HAD hydrolase-like protein [Methylobacter sp.]